MYKFIFIFFVVINTVNAQSFGDKFLPLMVEGGSVYTQSHRIFKIRDKFIELEKNKKGQIKLVKASDFLDKSLIDSLIKVADSTLFFDDNMFHIKKNVLLIDTIGFFSVGYLKSNKINFTVVRGIGSNNMEKKLCFNDTIRLQSVRVKGYMFVLRMRHYKSTYDIDYMFQRIGFRIPELAHISRRINSH